MHFSWAMDLDPKVANSQIKDALDPTLNRVAQEDAAPMDDTLLVEDLEVEGVDQTEEDVVMVQGNSYWRLRAWVSQLRFALSKHLFIYLNRTLVHYGCTDWQYWSRYTDCSKNYSPYNQVHDQKISPICRKLGITCKPKELQKKNRPLNGKHKLS